MGGNATFAGTTHQARVIAFIYVHMLAQRPLWWLGAVDDTPTAVSAETGGPGDDARIEYAGRLRTAEVQAKHGLSGVAKFRESIEAVRGRSQLDDDSPVIFAVDRLGSMRALRDFAPDFERLRTGRRDVLKADTRALIAMLERKIEPQEFAQQKNTSSDTMASETPTHGASQGKGTGIRDENEVERLLRRIHVVPVDLDDPHDLEAKLAIEILRERLEDPSQVERAWALLLANAGDLCKRRLRRTRKDLVGSLDAAGVKTRPPAKDDRWHRRLDGTKRLLQMRHAKAALASLTELEQELKTSPEGASIDPEVRFRLAQHQGNALIQLQRYDAALIAIGRALDVKAHDALTLTSGSAAALLAGDVGQARAFCDRAIASDQSSPNAWGALAQTASACGEPLPVPPAVVAESPHYRKILAHIASEAHNTDEVLRLTDELLSEGHRDADILFLRANALTGPSTSDVTSDRDRFATTERLSSEIIEQLHDDFHPLTVTAYLLRASARRRLGRESEADADLALARSLGSDDPNAIEHTARVRIDRDDHAGALDVLRHPTVDRVPDLLALRARIHARLGDFVAAKQDLDATRAIMADAIHGDQVRFLVADVALLLGDLALANSILAGVSPKGKEAIMFFLTRARLAFASDDLQTGESLYRQAALADRENSDDIFAELGQLLLKAHQPAAAVKAFDAATTLPIEAEKMFAAALYEANELVRAQALIDAAASRGPLPDWALALATDIATRQENTDAAIAHLTTLVERDTQTEHVRMTLARLLIESGRLDDAGPHLESLIQWNPASPRERMQVAQLLHQAGRTELALSRAFRAFRDAPNDPQIHRLFISLTLMSKTGPREVTAVGPDTWVRLTREQGADREHTIYADEPIDPTRNEMSLRDAEAAGLLGKVVGDAIERNIGTWQEQRWTVAEIKPAELHALQVAAQEFEYRFPSEPFFLTSFHVGDGTSIGALAPIIASLREREERVKQVARVYGEDILPLGTVAQLLGGSIVQAMEYFSKGEEGGRLWVEWAAVADQTTAREAASTATELVLTRSSIKTVFELKIEDLVASSYKLSVPRSLHDELRAEMADAKRITSEGQHILMSGDVGLYAHEVERGHPSLERNLQNLVRTLEWVEQNTQVLVRPLSLVQASDASHEELREKIGRSSIDAVTLAQHRSATLYADDLGLRKFAPSAGVALQACSTVTLLPILTQRGLITSQERDRLLLTLAITRYAHVHPTVELLRTALRERIAIEQTGLSIAFATLAGPQMTLAAAAKVITASVKAELMAPVQFTPPELIFSLSLAVMEARWPANLCASALARAVADELPLFPVAQQAFVQAAQSFLQHVAAEKIIRAKP